MSDEENNEPPHKVGDVIEERGVRKQVVAVRRTGGGAWMIETSAEPLAAEKGYLTLNQVLGFKVQHMAPPSPPEGGKLRDPAKLKAVDWNFNAVMKEPLEVRKLALVHELARECAAMREACRIYEAGLQEAKEWGDKEASAESAWFAATEDAARLTRDLSKLREHSTPDPSIINEKEQARLAARARASAAEYELQHVMVMSCNGQARQKWKQAGAFLRAFINRLPFGAGAILPACIAEDVPWVKIDADDRKKVLDDATVKERTVEGVRRSRTHKDMAAEGPGWPFDNPVEFARNKDEERGRLKYSFNDGITGRMLLAERHDNAHGLPILSEALELCVCLNFSDDEIMAAFGDWLKRRRANLHEDLKAFRAAGGSALRMKGDRVDKALKALSALRLRAKFNELEAADEFRVVYPAERAWSGKGNLVPMSQVWDLAKDAEAIGLEFLPECKLDSAVKRNH